MRSPSMAPVAAVVVTFLACAGDPVCAEDKPPAKPAPEAGHRDPVTTYRTYLEAVKRDDSAAAKECFSANTPVDSLARDIAVELWIAHHRFQKVVSAEFGEQKDCPQWRPDCTDRAIDRSIALLATATCTIDGDSAELKIVWPVDDEAVFGCSGDEPLKFLRVNGVWKIPCEADGDADEVAGAGTWGWCFRESAKLLNRVSGEIESRKLTTWPQALDLLEQGTRKLEEQYGKDHAKRMAIEPPLKD